jgi:hypothetical protein
MKPLLYNLYNMWKNSLVSVMMLTVFVLFCTASSRAQEAAPEKQLLGLINQARANPLLMAEMADLDKDSVLECFAGRKDILENGVRPLSANEKLGQTASAHSEEMLSYQYYDNISIDGLSPDERIKNAGYNPLLTGERIGIIGFRNFMEAEQAVWELFRNMFRDELACEKNQDWHILNPKFSEIGISVQAGTMDFSGNKTNIYIATCDFGASDTGEYATKRFLLQAINEVRNNPDAALNILNMDFEEAAGYLGRNGWILMLGAPPVAVNEDLFSYADAVSTDLLLSDRAQEPEMPYVSLGDVTESINHELEYKAKKAATITAAAFFGDQAPDAKDAIAVLFREMLKFEIKNTAQYGELKILNPSYIQAGIGYQLLRVANSEGIDEFYGILTCLFAEPENAHQYVVGRISWLNGKNQSFWHKGPIETISDESEQIEPDAANGLTVRIETVPAEKDENQEVISTACFTDPAGGYSLSLPKSENNAGYFRLIVSESGENDEKQLLHSEDFSYYRSVNLFKDITLKKNDH